MVDNRQLQFVYVLLASLFKNDCHELYIDESLFELMPCIREYISKRGNVKFTDLFEEYSKDLVVATFLSILDMCKQREITLKQDSNFGEIYIERVNV